MNPSPQKKPMVWAAVLHCGLDPGGSAQLPLRESLDSLRRMTYPNFRIVVIDNGSVDGSQAMIRKEYPGVQLVENGSNLGVMGGYNTGLRFGLDHSADWILLLNNDIVVDPEMLTRIVEAAEADPAVGIAGPAMYFHSRPDTFWYAGGRVNFFTGIISHRGLRERDRGQYAVTGETGYMNGCAMLIRRDVVERIGMLDLIFSPMYSEDVDYCLRARKAGYKLLYVPSAKLWHKVSAFSGGGMTPLKTRMKVQHNFIVLKRHARWYHWLTIPWCIGFMTIVFVVKELLKGNFAIIGALLTGFVGVVKKIFTRTS
jgi:GT2 family glycosyltransferase